ncbi:MAG: hypothetical protein KC620_21600, partial [Myxococcales bacterium]|nr:hypothetical protein [Myxococcales bacterium]
SGMLQTLVHTARADAGTPLAGVAQSIIDSEFPDGAQPITGLPFEEELIAVEQLVERLRADFGPHLDDLNLTGWLRRLDDLLPTYRDALAREVLITGTDLIDARARMQHGLQRIVAYVLGQYGGEGEAEKRTALLSPVEDQEDRLIAMLARRRSGQRTSLDIPAVVDPADGDAEPMGEDEALFAEEDEVDVDAEPLGDGLLPDPDAP